LNVYNYKSLIGSLFKIFLVLLINFIYYFTELKTKLLNFYLKFYSFLFVKLFNLNIMNNKFFVTNKDYFLIFSHSCTTFPFYLFLFSILILKNIKFNLRFVFFIVILTEILNFIRLFIIFFIYVKFNLSYSLFWLFHLILSSIFLFFLFILSWKLLRDKKIN
jgi:hypothetical protein